MGNKLHGGDVYNNYGKMRSEILDYSSNINPFGIPGTFRKALNERLNELSAYPDIDYTAARRTVAGHHEVDINDVVLGNGAMEIIFAIFRAFGADEVLIPCPTFLEYEILAEKCGVKVKPLILHSEQSFFADPDEIIKNAGTCGMVFLCNPNNPTGKVICREDMLKIIEACREKNILVVVDETFCDFAGDKYSVCGEINKYENLIVIRALTKFYGLPGIRAGYAIGSCEVVRRVREHILPWSVNTFAALAFETVFEDIEYAENTKKWIDSEFERFYLKLSSFEGMKVFSSKVNFLLVKLNSLTGNELRKKLLHKDILIRDASNFTGLDEHYVRFAIKDKESNDRFLCCLKDVLCGR